MTSMQVVFICVGNTCRSQMAEAIFNHFAPQGCQAVSAGSSPGSQVHPLAVKALLELDIDHSMAYPKGLTEDMIVQADKIVAMCSESEVCPLLPQGKIISYWRIPDPYSPVDDAYMPCYCQARDQIKKRVLQLIKELKAGA
ncbi:low molecular weight phosphatase family protein [Chloroflexota bacterium]